jgi:hypothetical protein
MAGELVDDGLRRAASSHGVERRFVDDMERRKAATERRGATWPAQCETRKKLAEPIWVV